MRASAYLDFDGEQALAVIHAPPQGRRDTAVVMVPPFGGLELASYLVRRQWADQLAREGYVTLRLTLPSSGDSGGSPRDPGRLRAWSAAVAECARSLREDHGAARVATIGIELGGLATLLAVAAGAPIDDLVLWATPGRGRALIREWRAFAKIEAEGWLGVRGGLPTAADEGMHVGGFLLSAETLAEIEAFDVRELGLDACTVQRALVLERDGMAPDGALAERLRTAGVEVTVAPGDGYGAMTNHPQHARLPALLVQDVSSWLGQAAGADRRDRPPAATAEPKPMVEVAGGAVRERMFTVPQPFGELVGILAEPAQGTARVLDDRVSLVLLNAGAVRRIGPNRMWVEIARRWAARGLPVARVDLRGLGDADDDRDYTRDVALHAPEFMDQIRSVLDALEAEGLGSRFILGGLCSGAYWSFQAALHEPRVIAACLLNPQVLFWDDWLGPSRDFRRGALRPEKWRKLSQIPRARYVEVARWAASAPSRGMARAAARAARRPAPDEVVGAFDRIRDAGKPMLLVFSEDEPLYEELTASGHLAHLDRWPNITLELIEGRDHTLRPFVSQSAAHAAVDRALERMVEATGSDHGLEPAPWFMAG